MKRVHGLTPKMLGALRELERCDVVPGRRAKLFMNLEQIGLAKRVNGRWNNWRITRAGRTKLKENVTLEEAIYLLKQR